MQMDRAADRAVQLQVSIHYAGGDLRWQRLASVYGRSDRCDTTESAYRLLLDIDESMTALIEHSPNQTKANDNIFQFCLNQYPSVHPLMSFLIQLELYLFVPFSVVLLVQDHFKIVCTFSGGHVRDVLKKDGIRKKTVSIPFHIKKKAG